MESTNFAVTPEMIQAAWIGADVPDNIEKLEYWIGAAGREILARVPSLPARLKNDPTGALAATVTDVVVAVVTRVFRNPSGVRSLMQTTGPFTTNTTYGGDAPGGLELTAGEYARLAPRRSRAFSVDLFPGGL